MKIGPPTGEGKDLRITIWAPLSGHPDDKTGQNPGMIVAAEMTWKEWNELVKDANYFAAYGKVRPMKPDSGQDYAPAPYQPVLYAQFYQLSVQVDALQERVRALEEIVFGLKEGKSDGN